jgi:biotin carboxyl carrier protein
MKRVTLVSGDKEFPFELNDDNGHIEVKLSGKPVDVNAGKNNLGGMSLIMGGRSYEVQVDVEDKQVSVEIDGERFQFEIDDGGISGVGGRRDHGGKVEVKAPMPGKVVKLLVENGETVGEGQGVLLFEAMKMQNEIKSPLAGSIVSLAVKEGQAVESREPLFTVKS